MRRKEVDGLGDSLDVKGGIKGSLKMMSPGHIFATDGAEGLERATLLLRSRECLLC